MKAVLVLAALAALVLLPAPASAVPPVCLEKSATVLQTSVDAQLTCGVEITVSSCPAAGYGPCWAFRWTPPPVVLP